MIRAKVKRKGESFAYSFVEPLKLLGGWFCRKLHRCWFRCLGFVRSLYWDSYAVCFANSIFD